MSDPIDKLKAEVADAEHVLAVAQETRQGGEVSGQPWDATMVLYLGSATLIFGLIVLGLMTYLFRNGHSPELVLRSFCVPVIVIGAVFLVVAGYSDQQIAPVIGLMGTIAGYLLGSRASSTEKGNKQAEPRDDIENPAGPELPVA